MEKKKKIASDSLMSFNEIEVKILFSLNIDFYITFEQASYRSFYLLLLWIAQNICSISKYFELSYTFTYLFGFHNICHVNICDFSSLAHPSLSLPTQQFQMKDVYI